MGNESINHLVFYNNPTHYYIRHTILELPEVLLRTFPPIVLVKYTL
jgi:hypothetical protein